MSTVASNFSSNSITNLVFSASTILPMHPFCPAHVFATTLSLYFYQLVCKSNARAPTLSDYPCTYREINHIHGTCLVTSRFIFTDFPCPKGENERQMMDGLIPTVHSSRTPCSPKKQKKRKGPPSLSRHRYRWSTTMKPWSVIRC